ncbi:hypothetical protein EKK58_05715 [Candidatus Dependentiae bacterium]|nr:MAG: hypothetical protein EKK58_05715 [Candidatus Dependentiae bacterium]
MSDNLASSVTVTRGQGSTPRQILQAASAVLAVIGIAERGPVGQLVECTSYEDFQQKFGGYTATNLETVAAMEGAFAAVQRVFFVRTVHYTTPGNPNTKTSAAATLELLTAESTPSPAYVISGNPAPYNLSGFESPNLVIVRNGEPMFTVTFAATAASVETSNTGPFTLADGEDIDLELNGATQDTITFDDDAFVDITAATIGEVINYFNAWFLTNGYKFIAENNSGKLKLRSLIRGTDSEINVVGGTALGVGKLNIATGTTNGTGDVANLASVTNAETKSIVEAALPDMLVTDVDGYAKISTVLTGGTAALQILGSSTALAPFNFSTAPNTGSSGDAAPTLLFTADDGTYANTITIIRSAATSGSSDEFDLAFAQNGVVVDVFVNLNMTPTSARYVVTIVNSLSRLGIRCTDLQVADPPANIPAVGTFGPMAGGNDGLTSMNDNDFIGGSTSFGKTGFRVWDGSEAITLAICPQRATAAVANALKNYCDVTRKQLIFAIHDPPAGLTVDQMVTYMKDQSLLFESAETSAIYYPRIKVATPNTTLYGADPVVVPPSGDIAAAYARVDSTRNVGGAFLHPGGIDVGIPRMLGLESSEVLDRDKRNKLVAALVNPISREEGTPFFLDGVLTCLSTGPFPVIGASRGIMIVAKSLILGLAFARHKNNTPELRSTCESLAHAFMEQVTGAGVLASKNSALAFRVDFGPGLNPLAVQKQRRIRGRVGVAYAEPAEFIDVELFPDFSAIEAAQAA